LDFVGQSRAKTTVASRWFFLSFSTQDFDQFFTRLASHKILPQSTLVCPDYLKNIRALL